MLSYMRSSVRERPWLSRCVALLLLVTAGVTWLWAHEGHEALPTRGAKPIKDKDGRVTGVILSREAREALGLQTTRVEKRAVPRHVLAYAALVTPWQRHAFATSRLAGRIEKLHVRPGDAVEAGQALAEVRSAELENLQLELLTARAEGKLSAKLLASLTKTFEGGTDTAVALAEARAKHQQNVNALEIARVKWASLGLPEEEIDRLLREGKPVRSTLPVRSPIAGTVTHADLAVGKVVEPLEHLFEVVDLTTVWTKIGVLERDLHLVKEGQEVELTFPAYPGETFRTKVQVKGPYLDPQTHLNTVWAELTNPAGKEPRFLPGLNGQAELILPVAGEGVAVPAASVIHDGVESYVLVEGQDTADGAEYLRVPIVAGARTADWIEVLGGDVYPGGYVVTRGGHELSSFFVPGVLRLSPEGEREAGLVVEAAARHPVESVWQVEGVVDLPPDRRAAVSAQMAGTLEWIGADRGQQVKAGQEIARVSCLELQTMQLDLLKADLELRLTEDTLGRLRKAEASVPARQLWEIESRRNTLRQTSETLGRKLRALGLSAGQLDALREKKELVRSLPVRATISGRVVRFDRALGQALKAEEVLFEVHDLSEPLIQGFVAESDLVHVRPGQQARVRLTADPSFVGDATVVRSGRVLGGDGRVLSVWVKLDRTPSVPLLHSQLARLTLVRGRAEAGVAVPLAAVVHEGSRPFVFVRQKDGTFNRRAVALGAADDRRVLVTGGLSEGETVAVAGATALQTAYASIR
jgi:cobalt-zinc-cadmium efflux system membrane fusion protein